MYGLYPLIPLDSWRLEIGDIVWDMNLPFPQSEFAGFRDPALGGINPGLLVSGGTITGFLGGVFGSADEPFVDFDFVAGPSGFIALNAGTQLNGQYSIYAIPEPSSLGLILIGLAVLMANRGRWHRAISDPSTWFTSRPPTCSYRVFLTHADGVAPRCTESAAAYGVHLALLRRLETFS